MSQQSSIDPNEPHAQRSYAPLRAMAIGAGAIGIIGLIAGFLTDVPREVFFRAYLVGILVWLGTSLGCLFFTLMHNLSGGEWGKVLRRPLEAGMACLPIMAVLFIPLFFGLGHNFEWAVPAKVAADRVLQHKHAFLNPGVVIAMTVAFLAIWSIMSVVLYGQGRRMRDEGERGTTPTLAYRLSAGGMVFQFFSVTFFVIVWVMSRDSHWYSSIIGFVLMANQALMGLSICTFALCWRFARSDDKMPVEKMTLNDVGTMMLANTIFWTYTSIAQLIILYSGNTSHGQTWYLLRGFGRDLSNGWQYVAVALIVLGFAIPFLLLLQRPLKQRMRTLGAIAVLVFLMRIVDVIWWVVPSGAHIAADHPFHPNTLHWVDIAAILGLGGVWLTGFFYFLSGRRVLSPATEPRPGHGHGSSSHSHSHAAPVGGQVVSHA
jgi:hypothetical protein